MFSTAPIFCGLPADHVPANHVGAEPRIAFDRAAGLLTIEGNLADNLVRQWVTSDGYVEVAIDGTSWSSRPTSPTYDTKLAGATKDTLRRIELTGGGGNDRLVLGDQSLTGNLSILADATVTIDGVLHVGHDFQARATSIEVTGSVAASAGLARLLSTTSTIVSGMIDVSAPRTGVGGRVEVLGPIVALVDGAVIDARGQAGGGTVLVGGDFQGNNPGIHNAQHTLVTRGASVRADALARGAGGTVIVWADSATRFYGLASARGGTNEGNGGLIEVSGKELLDFHGRADLSAPGGRVGTLLLDPTDIIVASGTGDSAADGSNRFFGAPSGLLGQILSADSGPTTIFESELEGLAATANIILQATNNVTINNLADNTLNLTATTGSLTIRADGDSSGSGNFSMNTGDTIRTQGGAVNIRGASLTSVGPINTTGSAGVAGGAVTLTADAGLISVTGAITTTGGSNASGGAVALTASGTVSVSGTISTLGGTFVAGNPGRNAGAVMLSGSSVSAAAITATGRSATSGGMAGGAGGAVLLDATSGVITLGGNITTTGGNGNGAGSGGNAGNITLQDAAILTGNRTLSAVGGTGGTAGAGGDLQLLGTVDGNVAATRSLTLTAGRGDVTILGAIGATNSLSAFIVTGNDIGMANLGGAAAGVSGATSVTATTAGVDMGSITFTGTTYKANAQTYTAPAGTNLLVNAGAATTFSSTADAITFATGTLQLADDAHLSVTTAGGAISAIGGIRGTSLETVALNSGGTTLTVGAIGSGDEIASVALTASTATLSGDVVTGDTVGNNVTITGAVALANAVGSTLTIDADTVSNDGTINITGTVTGAGRNLALLGGTISTAAITTTGGSNTNGGSVTLIAGGMLSVSGTITTSGGTFLAGNPGRNAGAVALTGSSVSVAAITAAGRSATSGGFGGGTGGAVLVDATAGVITLGGNITTTGGNGNGVGSGGNAGNITLQDAMILTGNRTLSAVGGTGGAAGAGGNLLLLGTVDGNVAATRTLTLTAGTGDASVSGTIGATTSLSALTITGNDISLAGVGGAAAGVTGATNVTAADFGGDIGSIQLNATMRTTGSQTYGGTGATSVGGDLITANGGITLNNAAVVTVSANFVSGTATSTFGSTLAIGGNTVSISASEISFAGNVSGIGGDLTLQPGTTTASMQLGGAASAANRLDLSPTELAFLQPGFSRITLGRADTTAAVTVNAVNLSNPITVAAGLSPLTVVGSVTSSANLALVTASGGIAINGAVNVGVNNLTLDSGGAVTQSASIVATGLQLLGSATFNLTNAGNDVDVLAAAVMGSVNYTDADDLSVATVGSTSGITTGNPAAGGSVTITALGRLTVDALINTGTGSGGVLTVNGDVVLNSSPVLGAGDISLTGVNQAPINNVPGSQSTSEDTPLVFSSANGNLLSISDPDAASGLVQVSLSVASGVLTLSGTAGLSFSTGDGSADAAMTFQGSVASVNAALDGLTYQPTLDYSGGDTLTITTDDQGNAGSGGPQSDSDAVAITITAVNDAPLATDDAFSVSEDGTLNVVAAGVLANDSDIDGNPLSALLVSGPANGMLALNPDGSFSYTPIVDFNGADTFTYRATDGTADSNVATVTITVVAANDAPLATGDAYSMSEASTLIVGAPGVLANDSDIDADPLSAVLVSGPVNGTLVLNPDGSFSYTPTANFNGADSFTYQANDGTASSNAASVTITVNNTGIVAVGSDSGPAGASRPTVHVYDDQTDALKFVIPASATYGVNNNNGIRVAVGDIDGDGYPDIITAPGRNTRPDIKIFRGTPQAGLQGTLLATIPAARTFGNGFVGGVNLAVGDVDGDGRADVIVAPDQGKATIKAFHNQIVSAPGWPFVLTKSFDAFPDLKNYNGGARLAVGNVTGSSASARELIVATGAGVAGKIRLYNLAGTSPLRMWTISDAAGFAGGLYVAAGDVNGNGIDDIVSSTGAGGQSRIRVYNHGGTQLKTFISFGPAENRNVAVRVTLRDADGDGRAEIFAAQGQDGRSRYRIKKFNALSAGLVDQFFAAGPDFGGGGLHLG